MEFVGSEVCVGRMLLIAVLHVDLWSCGVVVFR